MSDFLNKFKILKCTDLPLELNNIKINRVLTTKPKTRGSVKHFKNKSNIQKSSSLKKNNNQRKSISIMSNNPSTFESSLSNSRFDCSVGLKNQKNSYSKLNKKNYEEVEPKPKIKPLVYYVPKNIEYKLIFDIIFGHYYYLSKNKGDIKKIEKFLFELQKKFNEKLKKLYKKDFGNNNNNNDYSDNSSQKEKGKNENNYIINNISNINRYIETENKLYFFHKLEDLMAIYSLIIFYLVKLQNIKEARIIFLIMIKQNIQHIYNLENLIDFKILKPNKNNKYIMKLYQESLKIMIKIYSFLIKYGFFLHLSFYGNLFMKKYLNISYKLYLFITNNHKITNSLIENELQTKHWFCYLNYFSTYFSIANFLPLKIPISLCNVILHIYNTFDDKYYELKDKNLLLCTLYNRGIFLYMNGQSEEAINSLKEVKKKLFNFIEDYYIDNDEINFTKNTNYGSLLVENRKKQKSRQKYRSKGISSIQHLFNLVKKSRFLIKSSSNKNILSTYHKRSIVNVNKKLETYFLSNSPFNIMHFVNNYFKIYNIKADDSKENIIKNKATFNMKYSKESSHLDRRSFAQLTDIDKNNQGKLPNIFKSPLLIKTELFLAEIELDRKNYRAAYAYINHSLLIITILRKIKNIIYLRKFNNEQILINEFLNLIDSSHIKISSDLSERQEETSEDIDIDDYNIEKIEQFEKEQELQKKIILNKKVLKEIQKFFMFYTTLSAYQIKILNDTQPKTEKRNFLPILFENQFKNCLTVKQIVPFENLHEMSLIRYILLKDPNKLILPNNLNINILYFEKPESFSSQYFDIKNKKFESKEEKDEIQKRAHKIFKQIINSNNASIYIQNFLNSNYSLVMTILQKSTQSEIYKIINNPNILIKPVEKYKKKNKTKIKIKYSRHKSQVCFPNKKIFNKKLSIIDENEIRFTMINNRNNLTKKHLKTSKSDKFNGTIKDKHINRTSTSNDNEYLLFSKNKNILDINKNYNNDTLNTYSSYKLSINNSFE